MVSVIRRDARWGFLDSLKNLQTQPHGKATNIVLQFGRLGPDGTLAENWGNPDLGLRQPEPPPKELVRNDVQATSPSGLEGGTSGGEGQIYSPWVNMVSA